MRVYHGNARYTFEEVPVAHDGKPCWAEGTVWLTYCHQEGRDDGRDWCETDYQFDGFDALYICDENGNEVESNDRIKREIEDYLDVRKRDNILEQIDNDCHEFM